MDYCYLWKLFSAKLRILNLTHLFQRNNVRKTHFQIIRAFKQFAMFHDIF